MNTVFDLVTLTVILGGALSTYRVVHLLIKFGWVDFDLLCSATAQAEPGRGWKSPRNSQNQSQPGYLSDHMHITAYG